MNASSTSVIYSANQKGFFVAIDNCLSKLKKPNIGDEIKSEDAIKKFCELLTHTKSSTPEK